MVITYIKKFNLAIYYMFSKNLNIFTVFNIVTYLTFINLFNRIMIELEYKSTFSW